MPIDARFIKARLFTLHDPREWVYATEVATSTGTTRYNHGGNGGLRVIDAFAMNTWPSKQYQRIAYEIKVSKSDLEKELAEPTKRAQAVYLSDYFYFALAPGLYESLPRDAFFECGVIVVHEDGTIEKVHKPTTHKNDPAWPMPEWFVASFLRRARDEAWDWEKYHKLVYPPVEDDWEDFNAQR